MLAVPPVRLPDTWAVWLFSRSAVQLKLAELLHVPVWLVFADVAVPCALIAVPGVMVIVES